jgi:hypothetical protein
MDAEKTTLFVDELQALQRPPQEAGCQFKAPGGASTFGPAIAERYGTADICQTVMTVWFTIATV